MSTLSLLLIPALPLFTFLVLGLAGKNNALFKSSAGIIATLMMTVSCLLSLETASGYFFSGTENFTPAVPFLLHWLEFAPGLSIDMGIMIDPLSSMMLVVVTFVSLMVHLFSIGYMKGEERYSTYFAYLGLFTFSMLGLVMSSNLFQIYIFWELVGVSSFLLIGYYYEKASAIAAAKKAFIVTRFADLGFLIGILTVGYYSESFDFREIIARLTDHSSSQFTSMAAASFMGCSALTWGLLLIFMGGAGKSAMFPLHIWLPDAMEGPTPVSALIHAATMVVAGVFLVARLFPVFAISAPEALEVVTFIGLFSALFAAIIACTQTDIKRVLAYSTMSQIGFMMFSLGVSGYGAEHGGGFTSSLFHLFTHAFFKSLMFLGAGAIIHMVHSNEMDKMGGLRKKMPITHITFLIGCLAISGIPPFAGFFSKEGILHATYEHNPVLYYIALLTSTLTAFYMFRLYYSIFWSDNEAHSEAHQHDHEHHGEGSMVMKLPLILLGLASVVAGFVPFSHYVTSDGMPAEEHLNIMFSIAPVGLAIVAILFATSLYKSKNNKAENISNAMGGFYRSAKQKFYIDEVYLFVTQKILFNLVGRPAAWIDKNIVDGFWYLTGLVTSDISGNIKEMQSGKVQNYALWFLGGIFSLALIVIYLLS